MKTTQYIAPRQSAVVDLSKPGPGLHQVVIWVKVCSICRTNLTIHDRSLLAKFPLVSGHEFAGVTGSVGNVITEWKVSDQVTADNTELCDYCGLCRSDKPLYCGNFNSHGYNMSGGFVKYVLISHGKVFVPSDGLSFEETAFTKPTVYVVHDVDRIVPRFGDSILVFGTGPTSIIPAQLPRRAEAGCMAIVDPCADKLDTLRKYGFTDLVVMGKADPSKHTAEIKAIIPKGLDIIINATGVTSMFESCFHFIHIGSKVMAYGVCATDAKVPVSPYDISNQGYIILGSFTRTHYFGRALEYLENSAVQVKELISRKLPLEDCGKSLDHIVQKQACKVVVYP